MPEKLAVETYRKKRFNGLWNECRRSREFGCPPSRCAVTMNPEPDCTREVVVKLENGLHLGPSSQIVQLAQRFSSDFLIRKGDRTVDGKSMLDLLTLAAEQGSVLILEARGADAGEALQAIAALFERNFVTDQPR